MQSGILVQHGHIPNRDSNVVRSDITAIIGFIPRDLWPEGHNKGDYVEIILRQERDFWGHDFKDLFDLPTRRAVKDYFTNGGVF